MSPALTAVREQRSGFYQGIGSSGKNFKRPPRGSPLLPSRLAAPLTADTCPQGVQQNHQIVRYETVTPYKNQKIALT